MIGRWEVTHIISLHCFCTLSIPLPLSLFTPSPLSLHSSSLSLPSTERASFARGHYHSLLSSHGFSTESAGLGGALHFPHGHYYSLLGAHGFSTERARLAWGPSLRLCSKKSAWYLLGFWFFPLRLWNLKLDFIPLEKAFESLCWNTLDYIFINKLWPKFKIFAEHFFPKIPPILKLEVGFFLYFFFRTFSKYRFFFLT